MSDQITNNPEALRLFFTEDIFLVDAAVPSPASGFTNPDDDVAALKIPAVDMPVPAPSQAPTVPEVPAAQAPESVSSAAAPEISFEYAGANQRNILILVNDAQHPVSTLQGRELLGNILKSIGLSRNDCALVNYASYNGADFSALQRFFKPQYVFAFGVNPDELGLPGLAYNSIVNKDQSKLIFSSNLDALSGDAATKKVLWGSLKQIKL